MESYIQTLPSDVISEISKMLVEVTDIHNFISCFPNYKEIILKSILHLNSKNVNHVSLIDYSSLITSSNSMLFDIKNPDDILTLNKFRLKSSINLFIDKEHLELSESVLYLHYLLIVYKRRVLVRLIFPYKDIYCAYIIQDNCILLVNYYQILGYIDEFILLRNNYKSYLYDSLSDIVGDVTIVEYTNNIDDSILLPKGLDSLNFLLILEGYATNLHYYVDSVVSDFLSNEVFKDCQFNLLSLVDEIFLFKCIVHYCLQHDNLIIDEGDCGYGYPKLRIKSIDQTIENLIGVNLTEILKVYDLNDISKLVRYIIKKLRTIYLLDDLDIITNITIQPFNLTFKETGRVSHDMLELELAEVKLYRPPK